jgi:CheY-like chemotaxis protein
VLEALRADPATAELPVVVLTADAMPDTVARLEAQGVAALLTKPLDIRELLVQVDEHARQAVRA